MASNEVVSASTHVGLKTGARSIGAILIDAGRLKIEDAVRILRLQKERNLRFGDAGMQLGLVTQADIDFALSSQFDYPYLVRGESTVSQDLIAAYEPFSKQVEALRALRAQLMLRWFDDDPAHKALAIISAKRKEGRSYIAANLAVAFSQLGERTLLIDADMRYPSQHVLFSLDNRAGLSAVLTGRGGPETIQRVGSLRDLSVLPAGVQPPNSPDLLARPMFTQLLHDSAKEFDVILLDTPAAADSADAQTVTMRAGCALVVARRNLSRFWQVQGIGAEAIHNSATIVGTVLNDF